MELQPVVDFVKSVGFPGAIAIFVLWRLEPILRDLVAEIRAFRESTVVSTGALKEHVTETGDRVIREVGHDVRNALNTLSMRRDQVGAVPRFPLVGEPNEWADLTALACTIFLEAEGEPQEGKNAVGWVVRTRADEWRMSIHHVMFQPWQFSCWNDDYRQRAHTRLAAADGDELEGAWKAAAGAFWRLIPSPVGNATHYLNLPLTRKIRKGALPSWYAEEKVICVLGRHTFLRA